MLNKFSMAVNGAVVERIEEGFGVIGADNQKMAEVIDGALRYIVDVHGYMQRLESQIAVVESKIEDVLEISTDTNVVVNDVKTKNHIGKKPEFLRAVTEEVETLTAKEIRKLIKRAANWQQKGYMKIYSKVSEITGVDVLEIGKVRITEEDGLGFSDNNKTYINTLFKKGVHKEAAAIALDMIRNK